MAAAAALGNSGFAESAFLQYGCGDDDDGSSDRPEETGTCDGGGFLDYARRRGGGGPAPKKKKGAQRRRKSTPPAPRRRRRSSSSTRRPRAAAGANLRRLSTSEQHKLESRFGSKLLQSIPPGYHLVKKLGEGAFGIALLIGKSMFDTLVMKLQIVKDDRQFDHEVEMQKKFAAVHLAPKVLDVKTWSHRGQRVAAILMNKVDGILDAFLSTDQPTAALDQIVRWTVDAIQKMCDAKLTHGDMHFQNFAYVVDLPDGKEEEDDAEFVPVDDIDGAEEDENDEFKATRTRVCQNEPRAAKLVLLPLLIDFGWSSHHGCFPQLELIQALRTASRRYNKNMSSSNERYLQDNLYRLYKSNYSTSLKKSQDAYEREWHKLMYQQVKIVDDEIYGTRRPAARRRRRSSGGAKRK